MNNTNSKKQSKQQVNQNEAYSNTMRTTTKETREAISRPHALRIITSGLSTVYERQAPCRYHNPCPVPRFDHSRVPSSVTFPPAVHAAATSTEDRKMNCRGQPRYGDRKPVRILEVSRDLMDCCVMVTY